jgi:ribonuclease VapC
VKAYIVRTSRYGLGGLRDLDLLIAEGGMDLVPVDGEQAHVARDAFERFGRGRHPAALNFGDCFSYALARTSEQALLFKGQDFAKTDIAAVGY